MRKKVITYDKNNYQKTPQVERIYGSGKYPIKKTKTITTPRKTKVVEYGPINRTNKQTKTITKIKRK